MIMETILLVLVIHVELRQNLYTLAQVRYRYIVAHAYMTSYNILPTQTASYCFQDNCKIKYWD